MSGSSRRSPFELSRPIPPVTLIPKSHPEPPYPAPARCPDSAAAPSPPPVRESVLRSTPPGMFGRAGTSPPALSSGNSRRSLPGRPPARSSGNPNPQVPPPTVPATMSGSSRRSFPGSPDYVLLDSYGHGFLVGDDNDATGYGLVVGDDNDTTAQAFTEATGTIKVTFVIADLPCLSYFYVSCLDLPASPFISEPKIVCSAENLALLSFDLSTSTSCSPEYFIYRAGRHGRRPSLDALPDISTYFDRQIINPYHVGVLSDGGGTDFVLATFRMELGQYKLHIFRSKLRAWTTELLVPDLPSWLTKKRRIVSPDKVIALQGGLMGFVDLWKGILLCNVLKELEIVHFVPLPKLLPNNQQHYNKSVAQPIRDVTCTDGLIIRCVELEDIYSIKTSIPDASTKDLFFDSEAVDPTEEVKEFVGWRLITWSREICWDYWRKDSVVHVDELGTVSLPHPDYDVDGAAKLPLNTLKPFYPTMCGDDIVCLMSKKNSQDHDAWILTVDMRSKTVGEPVPFNVKRSSHSDHPYIPCALNKYLNSESGRTQVGLQNARFDGHSSLQLPPQNSNKYSNTSQQKRQRLVI